MKHRARTIVMTMAALVGSAAIGAVAWASIPDSAGVIHGCFKKSGGSLPVIDDSVTSCKSDETTISWNQTGPAGPAGVGDVFWVSDSIVVAPLTSQLLHVLCPEDRVAISAGWHLSRADSDIGVFSSKRAVNSVVHWIFGVNNPTSNSVTIIGEVLCANGTIVSAP